MTKKSDIQKICLLRKWCNENTVYYGDYYEDLDSDEYIYATGGFGHEAADKLLSEHIGLCKAYARLGCMVLNNCGIETYYCRSDKLGHAWNLVKLNGKWTTVDFTRGLTPRKTETRES